MNATLLGCAVGVLLLSGCSLGEDPEGWPPSLVDLRAELGTPARGTMRVKDFDKSSTYISDATFYVVHNETSCSVLVNYRDIYVLDFGNSTGCDLEEKIASRPYPYSALYAGADAIGGAFRLDNDSTISGVFYAGMKSDGLIGGTRRLAGTFVARRIASLE